MVFLEKMMNLKQGFKGSKRISYVTLLAKTYQEEGKEWAKSLEHNKEARIGKKELNRDNWCHKVDEVEVIVEA